ncbi:hypothetical protein JAB6_49680 [Janthinobacterium sp. HH104]|nr:hypothetical protein JAB6_49680 [Janthinobacterium sp. HH104]
MAGGGCHRHRACRAAAQAQGDRIGAAAVGHRGADGAGNGCTRCHAAGIGARAREGSACASAAVGSGDGEAVCARRRRRTGQGAVRRQGQAGGQAAGGNGIAIRCRAAGGADALAEGNAGSHGRQGRRRDADRWRSHRQRVRTRASIWAAARRTVRGKHGKVEGANSSRCARQQTGGSIQADSGRQGAGADGVGVWRGAVRGGHALAIRRPHSCRRNGAWRKDDGGAANRDRHGGRRRGAYAVAGRVAKAVRPAVAWRRRVGNAGAAGRRRAMAGGRCHRHRGCRATAQAQGDRVGAAAVGYRGADIAGNGRTRCHAAGIGA